MLDDKWYIPILPEEDKTEILFSHFLFACGESINAWKILLETRERVLNCYAIRNILYGTEYWTISPELSKTLEVTDVVVLTNVKNNICE